MTDETINGRELHMRSARDGEDFKDYEFFVDGEWRPLSDVDVLRMRNSPLCLWDEHGTEFRVPYDSDILMRRKPESGDE